MPFPSGTYVQFIRSHNADVANEFEHLYAQLEGFLRMEHKETGAHGDVTATSATVSGDVAATGNVVALQGTDEEIRIGQPDVLPSVSSEYGMLMGGTSKGYVWIVQQSGLDSGNKKLTLYNLARTGAGPVLDIHYSTAASAHVVTPASGSTGVHLGDDSSGLRFLQVHANTLKALSSIQNGGFELQTGVITPATITADQNNYSPDGLSTSRVLRLGSDASRTITGLAAQTAGTRLTLFNVGTNDIVLAHADTVNSSAANVFICPGAVSFTLHTGDGVDLWYDGTSSLWRLVEN